MMMLKKSVPKSDKIHKKDEKQQQNNDEDDGYNFKYKYV